MDSELILGLQISILGLAITFLAMGLVILIMILLLHFFPTKSAEQEKVAEATPEAVDEQALEEMAVALAVGICLLEQDGALAAGSEPSFRDPSLGRLLEE